jgi:fimbrial chaperone protein
MIKLRTRARAAALAALVPLACFGGVAAAAQFRISNVRLHLDAATPVDTIVLTSEDANDVTFEVHVMRWTQGADGKWEQTPSQDLVVHPLILKMPAKGEARLRVGSISPTVTTEHAYRVELQELPGPRAQSANGQVRMLTKVSLPVFVEPPGAKANPTIEIKGSSLVLGNTGTAYLAPTDGMLTLRDAKGRTLHTLKMDTNYVLPGAHLPFKEQLPASACAHAASVELALPDAKPITAAVSPGSWRCAP